MMSLLPFVPPPSRLLEFVIGECLFLLAVFHVLQILVAPTAFAWPLGTPRLRLLFLCSCDNILCNAQLTRRLAMPVRFR